MATILTVDDSDLIRRMLITTLTDAGHRVLEADDGQSGLALVTALGAEAPLDLVIVDLNMEGMDGISMVRKMREIPRYANVPVFMLTTETNMALKAAGKQAGIECWIIKPFHGPSLVQVITKVLARRAA